MTLDFAKELYTTSWSRRDALTGGIATPISVTTAIGGAVVLMVRSFEVDLSYRALLFALAVSLAAIALALAAYNLTRSYFGYDYQTIPTARQLANHFASLEEYFRRRPSSERSADHEFTKYLFGRYVEAAEVNTINNESKA